jgi:hypothetical protein
MPSGRRLNREGSIMRHLGTDLVILFFLLVSFGCGLDGVTGELIRIDGNDYIMRTSGDEMTLHVDQRTRKDDVMPGDDIHAYVAKDGHAKFIQRLEE